MPRRIDPYLELCVILAQATDQTPEEIIESCFPEDSAARNELDAELTGRRYDQLYRAIETAREKGKGQQC